MTKRIEEEKGNEIPTPIKPTRTKVAPEILERVKLFSAALNLDKDDEDEFEDETYE